MATTRSKASARPRGRARVDLTQGPILKRLLSLAWPLFVGNILTTFYNLADMFWVAQVGTDAVAAIAITFPTVWLTFSFGLGVTIAGVAFVSQYTGAGKTQEAAHTAGQVVVLAALVGVFLGTLGIIFREPIISAMGATDVVLELASVYLLITFISLPLRYIYFAYRAVSQGVGDGKTPRNLLVLTVMFNVIADPFFIFGWWGLPAMGVAGAAWATVLAELIGAVISMYFLFSGRIGGIRLQLRHLKPQWDQAKAIARLGLAGSLDMGSRGLSSVLMAGIVARFGTVEAAAYGIVMRLMSVVWTSSGAMEQAAASGVGQNLGAGQPERAERLAWSGAGVMFLFLSTVALLLYFFAEQVMGLFRVSDEVVQTGARFIRLHVLSYGFWGAMEVLQGGFRGAGKTLPPAIISIGSRYAFQIPVSIYVCFTLGYGADGFWTVMLITYLLFPFIMFGWFKLGTWKQRTVVEAEPARGSPSRSV